MTDIEKVIKGLEELEGFLFKEYTNIKAEESKIYYDRFKSLSDALELLKEHEPIEPIAQLDRDEDYIFLCSNCKGEIFGGDVLHDNYCPTCGRLVNWHGRY